MKTFLIILVKGVYHDNKNIKQTLLETGFQLLLSGLQFTVKQDEGWENHLKVGKGFALSTTHFNVTFSLN